MSELMFILLFNALLVYNYLLLRRLVRQSDTATPDTPTLDTPANFTDDAWALLRGGAAGLLRFVLLELFLRGKVKFRQAPSEIFSLPEAMSDEPLRRAVLQKTAGKTLTKKDFKPLLAAYPIQRSIQQQAQALLAQGYLRPRLLQEKLKRRSKLFFTILLLAWFGVWFFLPDKLWFFVLPALVISIMVLLLKPFHRYARTPAGDAVLKEQQEAMYEAYQNLRETGQVPADASVLFFLAVFGFAALSFYSQAAGEAAIVWTFAIEFSEGGSEGDSCSGSDGSDSGDGGGDGGGD